MRKMDRELEPRQERKAKRPKKGKGRKERMKTKLEKLALENEEQQQKVEQLTSVNLKLKRLVDLQLSRLIIVVQYTG